MHLTRTFAAIAVITSILVSASFIYLAHAADDAVNRPPPSNARNDDARPLTLPAPLVALKPTLQGKTPAQVLAIVIKELGEPTRNIGSGLSIPQWDIAGGVLTVHPLQGPAFTQDGSRLWLIDTQNLVEPNVIASYEMTTVADPKNHGTRFWMGNLDMQGDGRYSFRPSHSNFAEKAKNPSNFFFEHPSGTFVITYPPTVTATSVLEKLDDKALLATLDFTADNPKGAGGKASMSLRVDIKHRRIHFAPAGDQTLTFEMDKAWERFWK